jgi:O-antigen/teichoic acid export membrane protein
MAMQIVTFGLPSIAGIAGGWGLNEADKVVVAKVGGMDAAGFYTAAAALAAVSLTFLQALTNALFPGLFSALSAEPHRVRALLTRYVSIFVIATALFSVLVILGYKLLANAVLPPRYLQVEGIFIALILSSIAISIYRPFGLAADFFHLARTRAVAIIGGGGVSIWIEYLGMRHGELMWVPAGIAAGYLTASAILVLGIHVAGVAKPSGTP